MKAIALIVLAFTGIMSAQQSTVVDHPILWEPGQSIVVKDILGMNQRLWEPGRIGNSKGPIGGIPIPDHFALLALHVVIAMRHDDGSDSMNEHIETAFEQLEIESNMPIEQTLLKRFRILKLRHHNAIVQKVQKAIEKDNDCFDAYIPLIKQYSITDFAVEIPECKLHANTEVTK